MDIGIKIKKVKRGNARIRKGKYYITMPQWAMDRSEAYWIYYLCHELAHVTCHQLCHHFDHNDEFKMIEDVYLEDFGMTVVRCKAYPKTLTLFGKVVYRK